MPDESNRPEPTASRAAHEPDRRPGITRRKFLKYGGAAGLAVMGMGPLLSACGSSSGTAASSTSPSAGSTVKDLTILSYGGIWGDEWKKNIVEPFTTSTGIHINIATADNGSLVPLAADLKASRPAHDLVLLTNLEYATVKAQGNMITDFDSAAIPNAKDLLPIANDMPHSANVEIDPWGILYNTDQVKTAPTSWSFFWDPTYWDNVDYEPPGAYDELDNLMAAAIVAGGTWKDVDAKGFPQVQLLKGHAQFQETFTALTAFEKGSLGALPFYNNEAYFLQAKKFPADFVFPSDGVFPVQVWIVMPANIDAGRKLACAQFVNYWLSPDPQVAMATKVFSGPTNRTVTLPPGVASKVVYGKTVDALVPVDWNYVLQNRDAWTKKWQTTMT